jgi:uncharacterized protein (DUF362 family)
MVVAIKKVEKDVVKAVSDVMDAASYKEFIPRDQVILLKVNLGWDMFIPGSVTNPAVFEGVVRKLKGYAKAICVIESDQVLENINKAYLKSKISEIAKKHNVKWINLSYVKKVKKKMPMNRIMKTVIIPKVLTKGIIVTLPVMKTHNKTTVTLSLKNQWGCISKMRHMYHLYLDEAICDVNAAMNVKFAIVDGTIAMEGNGPKNGIPREIGIVGAGNDLVEVDSVFANQMGFNPREISHIVEAEKRGLGTIGTKYIGDDITPIKPFKPAEHNFVSKVELLLRRSSISDLVFKTPLLLGMVVPAKFYYYFYDLFKGRAIRNEFRKHVIYGKYL